MEMCEFFVLYVHRMDTDLILSADTNDHNTFDLVDATTRELGLVTDPDRRFFFYTGSTNLGKRHLCLLLGTWLTVATSLCIYSTELQNFHCLAAPNDLP